MVSQLAKQTELSTVLQCFKHDGKFNCYSFQIVSLEAFSKNSPTLLSTSLRTIVTGTWWALNSMNNSSAWHTPSLDLKLYVSWHWLSLQGKQTCKSSREGCLPTASQARSEDQRVWREIGKGEGGDSRRGRVHPGQSKVVEEHLPRSRIMTK